MKAILIGNEALYNRLAKEQGTGFSRLTSHSGTPIMLMRGVPISKVWVVDIISEVEIIGDHLGYVTIDSFLEAL